MKIANMEVWIKDHHACLQISKKQFEDSDGVIKLSLANLRQLIRMVVDKKNVTLKELQEVIMKLTVKRISLTAALAEKLDMGEEELRTMYETVATGSVVPEKTIVELFLEADAMTD